MSSDAPARRREEEEGGGGRRLRSVRVIVGWGGMG
jgi:hypothetical protein